MSHLDTDNGYGALIERLNRAPEGAPPSELLYKILALLFTEQEAQLLSALPMRPVSAATAAQIWRVREVTAFRTLEGLAERALLLDAERDGEKIYLLPPPMAGFFQFALMRVRSDIDQETLSELLYQYLNMEQDFVSALFCERSTRMGRVLVDEEQIPAANVSRVLNYERASEAIQGAWKIGVATCSCRHKMQRLGRGCSAPMETCLTFDSVADSLIRHGHARQIDASESRDLVQQAKDQNLVQFAENVQGGVKFLCNCCGCCCEGLVAARRFSSLRPIQTTNFVASLRREHCSGCGLCVDACPIQCLALISAKDPRHPWKRRCVHDTRRCLGCGICARNCKSAAVALVPREERLVTPVDTAHRVVQMALERGKLQNLVWDNAALPQHRAMAAIVGTILKLPPVQQALASSTLGSRYLNVMIQRHAQKTELELMRY
jgi:Pyruvate/2-oxoacid:ferredoxin oxidoreductase delta subunit